MTTDTRTPTSVRARPRTRPAASGGPIHAWARCVGAGTRGGERDGVRGRTGMGGRDGVRGRTGGGERDGVRGRTGGGERDGVRGRTRWLAAALALGLLAATAACGDDAGSNGSPGAGRTTIRLLTHDSFAVSKEVMERFTRDTGIEVKLVQGGDAGKVVNQAILTKGNPEADVLFGVDSTLLTRALEAGIFEPYETPALPDLDPQYALDDQHRVTPVDYGDVCLNYDKAWFADHPQVPVPGSLEDLAKPAYRDLLVVENPATSSTGLAFLLSSISHFGTEGYLGWWRQLRGNGVAVVDGWEQAYQERFSGSGDHRGDRPLVVSYASSPPAEVVYADPPIDDSPTGVVTAGCYRQVEGVGILRGTRHEAAARQLVDFMVSEAFQADVPMSMFVYPVRKGVALPDVFTRYAVTASDVAEVAPGDIEAHRSEWIDAWTDAVVR